MWNNPEGIAADSQGNIWLASNNTVANSIHSATSWRPTNGGQIQVNNYNQTLAIDLNDRAVVDDNSYWVSLVDSLGNNTTLADTPPPLSAENIAGFGGVVVDASNNYWAGSAANNSSALVTFNVASGTGINAKYTGGGLVNPIAKPSTTPATSGSPTPTAPSPIPAPSANSPAPEHRSPDPPDSPEEA